MGKTGAPWRDMPASFGKWRSVLDRFMDWAKSGRWAKFFRLLTGTPDVSAVIMDSTVFKAVPCAAAAREAGAAAVIPSKRNRKIQRPLDAALYKERNVVERRFCLMKSWRRICLCSDKRACAFLSWIWIEGASRCPGL